MSEVPTETIEITAFDKTFLLIGRYLSAWGHMESQIDLAIRHGLGLSPLQGAIVCVNSGFTSKCHILQTLESLGRKKKKGTRHNNDRLIETAKSRSVDRNMIAHNRFFPGRTKKGAFCVDFSMVVAKGNLDIPSIKWTEKDFDQRIEELYQIAEKIKEIGKTLSSRKIIEAFMKARDPKPTFGLLGPGLSNLPHPQLQAVGLLGNLTSIQKKEPQIPQKPEE